MSYGPLAEELSKLARTHRKLDPFDVGYRVEELAYCDIRNLVVVTVGQECWDINLVCVLVDRPSA